eukprot:Gb_20260 [translate_table: standard]
MRSIVFGGIPEAESLHFHQTPEDPCHFHLHIICHDYFEVSQLCQTLEILQSQTIFCFQFNLHEFLHVAQFGDSPWHELQQGTIRGQMPQIFKFAYSLWQSF